MRGPEKASEIVRLDTKMAHDGLLFNASYS